MVQDPSLLATLVGGGAVLVGGITMIGAQLLHSPGDRPSWSWFVWAVLAVVFGGILALSAGIAIVF